MFRKLAPLITFLVLVVLPLHVFAQSDLLIFGGPDHDHFLGCLVCNPLSAASICNSLGPYGNEFSSTGMFNEFSTFGNNFSLSSPWNAFSLSKSVPVVVDREGHFYGYFTINDARPDAVAFASDLRRIYEAADGDLEEVRQILCRSLGYSP